MSNAVLDALQRMTYAFPKQNIPAKTITVYLESLSDLPEPVVVAAIGEAINTKTFWPSVKEIRDIIAQHANGADDLAETAWAEVEKEARRIGYNRRRWEYERGESYVEQPTFSTTRIAEAVESVGWKNICHGDNSEGATRRDFIFAYRNLRKRDVNRVQRGEFGIFDAALADGDDSPALEGGAT